MLKIRLYRYHSEQDELPRMEELEIDEHFRKKMVLDVLEYLKERDTTLTYRRSCREGVCGSDGMNINGKNGLACITSVAEALNGSDTLVLRPLPGMPVIRDLAVDQTQFFRQFEKIRPWLIHNDPPQGIERLQSPEEREKRLSSKSSLSSLLSSRRRKRACRVATWPALRITEAMSSIKVINSLP